MEDGNLAVLVDAKTEYTKQLVNILKPSLYEGLKEIFIEARDHCSEEDDVNNTLPYFQSLLSQVPKWNQDIINTKSELIVTESKCDWLDDLITAVFISHTRILTSINYSKNKKKINLKIPKVEHFIHQCYISSARCFYKIPYMFDDTVTKYDFQRNRHEAEALIEESIQETIRKQLPVRNILKEYLDNESEETPENKEESYEENLRKMVKTEIEKCSKEQNSKLLETFKTDNNEPSENEPSDNEPSNNEPSNNEPSNNEPSNNEFEESKEASESLEISESTENNEKETPINEINLDTKEETKEDTGNKSEILTEESKVEESKVEESKVEESKVEEPKVEEPKLEEPKLEESKLEETKEDLQSNNESDILKNSTVDKETELISAQSNDKQLIVFNESENNTLSEKLDNSNIQEDEINLDIDELNLVDMNDLNNLEEVYLDGNPTTIENTKETPDELQNVEVKEVKLDSNIKKIVLDSKDSDKNKDDIKKKVLKNYIRKREDFDFFADADENDE